MGDRALITTKNKDIAIYTHWLCGKLDAYLCYCWLQHFRCPENDEYGYARLCQVICNDNNAGLSVGICRYDFPCYADDNGIFYIKGWHVIDHEDMRNNKLPIERVDYYKEENTQSLLGQLIDLNDNMPSRDRLEQSYIIIKYRHWIEEEMTMDTNGLMEQEEK